MGAAKATATRTAQGTAELSGTRSPHHTWTRPLFERDRRALVADLRIAWQLLDDLRTKTAQNVEPEEFLRALKGIEKAGKYLDNQ